MNISLSLYKNLHKQYKTPKATSMRKILSLMYMAFLNSMFLMAQPTVTWPMDRLGRGLVALPGETKGQFVSWRLLGTDAGNTTFDVLRDGTVIAKDLSSVTCYQDDKGRSTSMYQVATKVNGKTISITEAVTPWTSEKWHERNNGILTEKETKGYFLRLHLDQPAGGSMLWRDKNSDNTYGDFYDREYHYFPQKMSAADLDGDGEYEIIVKWEPSNTQATSSKHGPTGQVYYDAYKIDRKQTGNCKRLWRLSLGQNIRAGSGQNHFMVYDLDGDGMAEVVIKTAPGSTDNFGTYVNQVASESEIRNQSNTKNWMDQYGKTRGGAEYLTVFNGKTGAAVHTIYYNPNRNRTYGGEADGSAYWGADGKSDDAAYGHRGEAYLACVAYLDGPGSNPSVVMTRGVYTYAFIWAVDYKNGRLQQRWLHFSASNTEERHWDKDPWGEPEVRNHTSNTFGMTQYVKDERVKTQSYNTAYHQGNHSIAVADVDGDGKDEIIFGGATIDDNGWLLYSTGTGHGDAMHVGKFFPDRDGLQVIRCLEYGPYGVEIHDAKTGEKIFHRTANGDTGRCMVADIDNSYGGAEFWAADGSSDIMATEPLGDVIATTSSRPGYVYRIYWDGDALEELTGDGKLEKWDVGSGAVKRQYIHGKNLYYWGNAQGNGTKGYPALQADIMGDWREEIVMFDKADSSYVNIFTTSIPTKYRVPTLMHDHLYRMSIVWQNVCYSQPPHLGYSLPQYLT